MTECYFTRRERLALTYRAIRNKLAEEFGNRYFSSGGDDYFRWLDNTAIMKSNISMEHGNHRDGKEDRFLFLFTYDNPRGCMQDGLMTGGLKYDLENKYVYQDVSRKIHEVLQHEEKQYDLRIQREKDKESLEREKIEKIKQEYNLN